MVIVGAVAVAVIAMESAFVLLPAPFVALTVKLDEPVTLGVPEITAPLSVKPVGNAPESMLQVIGSVPEAARVWL